LRNKEKGAGSANLLTTLFFIPVEHIFLHGTFSSLIDRSLKDMKEGKTYSIDDVEFDEAGMKIS
jgi:hypothetical protein